MSTEESRATARLHFLAIAANSSVRDLTAIDQTLASQVHKRAAQVYEALLYDRCPNEVAAALATDGTRGLDAAFFALGKKASDDLLSIKESAAEIEQVLMHMDLTRLKQLLSVERKQ